MAGLILFGACLIVVSAVASGLALLAARTTIEPDASDDLLARLDDTGAD
jgi:hypothetical protein